MYSWRRHLTSISKARPKNPVWISDVFVCRMARYFPPGRTDLVQFPLEHISYQELLDKMLKDRDEVAVFKCRKLLHVEKFSTHSEFNSFLIFTWPTQTWVMRETCELFSRERVQAMRPGELTLRKLGTTSPQLSRKPVFVENRRSRTGSNCSRSFCIQCSVDSKERNWGRLILGRNDKWNRKFSEFPNFQKKGQPREVNRNFRNEFPETFRSIRFWTGNSGKFGRMERAPRQTHNLFQTWF